MVADGQQLFVRETVETTAPSPRHGRPPTHQKVVPVLMRRHHLVISCGCRQQYNPGQRQTQTNKGSFKSIEWCKQILTRSVTGRFGA